MEKGVIKPTGISRKDQRLAFRIRGKADGKVTSDGGVEKLSDAGTFEVGLKKGGAIKALVELESG